MSGSYKSDVSEFAISQSSRSFTLRPTTLELTGFKKLMTNSMVAMFQIASKSQDVFIEVSLINYWASVLKSYLLQNTMGVPLGLEHVRSRRYLFQNFPIKDENKIIDLTFVLNTLNFNLWNPHNAEQWTVRNLTGYRALYSALKRAVEEGRPMWDPDYYSELEQIEVEIIFRGDSEEVCIPLIHERVKTFHEIGQILLDKYEGTFVNCIKTCGGNALKLHHLLYNEFESYRDTVNYEGEEVYIGSKAAALISDLSHMNKITGETHWLSMILADYCAPQTLVDLRILQYSDKLKARFAENDEPLEQGSKEDIEIRCCTLMACKRWAQLLLRNFQNFEKESRERGRLFEETFLGILSLHSLNVIDNYVWHIRYDSTLSTPTPLHNIRSLYY